MKTLLAVLKVVLVGLPCCLSLNMDPEFVAGKKDQSAHYDKQSQVKLCREPGICAKEYGGFCFSTLSEVWPVCDTMVQEGLCNASPEEKDCRCCIKCSRESCFSDSVEKSACKKDCDENEFSVSQCNRYCKCCQPCKPKNCKGRCVSHPDLCCEAKEYIEGFCEGKLGSKCTCCVTCKPDLGCEKSGGQCVTVDEECPCGFWPSPYFGCNNGSKRCKCCTPCPPSNMCSGGIEPGRCVPDKPYCNGHDEYISDEACCQGGCSCCKTCQPDDTCVAEGGNCYSKEVGCGPGMVASRQAKCTTDNCVCCIPEPCPDSCKCIEGPNPGRCVAEPFRMKYNEYLSEEKCIGCKCSCYKTCTPDPLCSAVNGTCFTTSTGCGRGLVPSKWGSCNSKNCICCVERGCSQPTACTDGEIEPGRCEKDRAECSSPGEYISEENVCVEEGCFCCKTCQPDESCEGRGKCFDALTGCGPGFKKSEVGRCKNTKRCICCEPNIKCVPTEKCSSELGDDYGRCEVNKENCSSPGEYINEDTPCEGKGCFCCKTCEPDASCTKLGGRCYVATGGCPLGLTWHQDRRCQNNDKCICCSKVLGK